ncbi:MAG: hypothetical protein GX663_08270 [Clostridiales bacterium]|nr:hypothetical protein [Clostridiales bacterium]
MKNKSKKSIKIISGFIAVMLVLSMGLSATYAFGAEKNTKDETVYVITGNDGTQEDTIVSDHLCNNTGSDTLEDVSDLTDIENVKGDEKFTQEGDGRLLWNAKGNDIYYQGDSDKAVPVKMDITYYLNGKKISGNDLKDAKGDVKIVVNYENTTNVPFIAITGFMAEKDCMKNIKVSNGKIIDDGEKQIVVGMAAPGLAANLGVDADKIGLSDSVTFTGQAEGFTVDSMMTVVTSDIFEDVDAGAIDGLNMDGQINLLDSSAKQLVSGADTLYNGINMLNNKSQELTVGIKKLNDGATELYQKLDTNLNIMKSGTLNLQTGATALNSKLPEILAGVQGVSKAVEGVDAQLQAGIAKNNAAQEELAQLVKAYPDMVNELTYKNLVKDMADSNTAMINAEVYTASGSDNPSNMQNITDGMLSGLDGNGTVQNPGLVNVAKQVKDGSDGLAEGLAKATADTKSLTSGAKDLAAGMGELNNSTGTLIAGSSQLNAGSQELSLGLEKFYKEGIAKIVNLYNGQLRGKANSISSTLNNGKNYSTFTQLSNGMKGTVKFIYKTEISQ